MPDPAIAHLSKPGANGEKAGKSKPRQRRLRALSGQRAAEDHSVIQDWVQSQLHKLGDIIHVIDHGGVLLDKDQAVLACRALGDAYAYRSEMLAAAPESDMLRGQYLALVNQLCGPDP